MLWATRSTWVTGEPSVYWRPARYVPSRDASVSIGTSPNTQLLKKSTGASGINSDAKCPNVPWDPVRLLSGFAGHKNCQPFSKTTGGRTDVDARSTSSGSTVIGIDVDATTPLGYRPVI